MNEFEPFVSIIIATRNEANYIGDCVSSLISQTYPKDKFELLIIDGLSNDRTLEIAQSFSDRLNLRVISNPKIKHVFAFNKGIEESRGDYFIILSGHSFVGKDFIKESVETFRDLKKVEPNLAAVGGSLQMVNTTSFGRRVACLFASPFSGSSSFWRSGSPYFAKTVVFGFYDKRIVQQVGCFDDDLIKGQDFELNLRLRKNGFKLYCNPNIKSHYYVRHTFRGFLKQAFDNGAAKGICIKKRYFSPIWLIPSIFIAFQVLTLTSLLFPYPLATLSLLILFAFYWIVNIFASFKVSNEKQDSLILPALFWCLHVITGFGFIAGLLKGMKKVNS